MYPACGLRDREHYNTVCSRGSDWLEIGCSPLYIRLNQQTLNTLVTPLRHHIGLMH